MAPSPTSMVGTTLRAVVAPRAPAVANLLALSNISAANWYSTGLIGGEPGVSTGFGAAVMCRVLTLTPGVPRVIFDRYIPGQGGWTLYENGQGFLEAAFHSSTVTTVAWTSNYKLMPDDFGRVLPVVLRHTGTHVRLDVSRLPVGTPAAITGYTPAPNHYQSVGIRRNGGTESPGIEQLAWLTFRGTPTDAQLQTGLFDYARANGDFPASFAGATVTHRHSLREALAGQTVIDGQLAPATIADTVTGAAADTMTRTGSPMVRVIDTSVEGRQSSGLIGFDAASFLQTALDRGLRGSASGSWVAWLGIFYSLTPGTVSLQEIVRLDNSLSGWSLATYNNQPYFGMYNGSNALVASPFYSLTAGDLGVPVLLVGVRTAGAVRFYVRDVQIGADAAITGYTAPPAGTSRMTIGARVTGSYPLTSGTWLGTCGGDGGAPSPAQVAQLWADVQRTGRIQSIAGLTTFFADPTQDVIANGGASAGMPAQVLDRVGTDHLSRVGTGLQVSRRTERLWPYETTPIVHGAASFTAANHLRTASALADIGGGPCWFGLVYRVDAQTGVNALQILASHFVASTVPGLQWYVANNGGQLGFSMLGAGGSGFTATAATIAPADVGKLDAVLGVYTGGALQLYRKRVLASSVPASFTAAAPTTQMYFGSENSGTPRVANGCTLFNGIAGVGVPTLAHYQAWFDAVIAEDGALVSLPGMVNAHRWRFANASGVPATVTDEGAAAPNNITRIGTPIASPAYARAFAA